MLHILYGISDNHFNRGSNEFELMNFDFRKWHNFCITYHLREDDMKIDVIAYMDGEIVGSCKLAFRYIRLAEFNT